MIVPPKISIIIPVFNAEAYLHACLNSATQQSLKEIEIICVNDCSTDSTPAILLDHARRDERIKVIDHDTNQGEGAARNTGLDDARGEYVFHLDADDTIAKDAMDILYTEAAAHHSEMVKGGYDIIHETGDVESDIWSNPDKKTVNTNIFESIFLQKIPTSHWSYLYERKFLNKHNIRYRTDLNVGLDLVALTTALVHATAVTLVPDIIYHYHDSNTSITKGTLSTKLCKDAIRTRKIIADILNDKGIHKAAASYLKSWDYIIITQWLRMPASLPPDECSQVFSDFRALIIDKNITPWVAGTPHHHRHILALVLADRDEEALAFLNTAAASKGFSNHEDLVNSLKFVLTQAPGDIGSLTELAKLARAEGDLESALTLVKEIIKQDSDNFGAYIQTASMLKEVGRYDESHASLDKALKILIKDLEAHEDINTVNTVKNNIILAEKNAFNEELSSLRHELAAAKKDLNTSRGELKETRNKLIAVQVELNLVYQSISWRATGPLRKIMAKIKQHT